MKHTLPSLIITGARCISSPLHHGIASSLITHHLIAESAQPGFCAIANAEAPLADSRITGDDYW